MSAWSPTSAPALRAWRVAAMLLALAGVARAQEGLGPNEDCTIQVLNQTVHVRPDGGWEVPNIPVNGGQVRARLHCNDGFRTRVGQSNFFLIAPNRMNAIRPVAFAEPEPGPTRVVVEAESVLLGATGEQTQLRVTGTYADGATRDLTLASAGTSYVTTDAGVAALGADGLVVAGKSGTAVLTAWNEGVTAAVWVTVRIGDDVDGDGLPDDYELAVGLDPKDPVDARADQDADGLTALREFEVGSNPFAADTDGDTLSDGEEVTLGEDGWITNPAQRDTDLDLLSDWVELATGTDPTSGTSYDLDAALTGLTLRPSAVVLVYNPVAGEASVQLRLTGLVIDGSGIDLTGHPAASFESLNLAVAGLGATPGEIFAGQDGTTEVVATVASHEARAPVTTKTFTPLPLSRVSLGCYGNGVALAGDRALVACGAAGLRLVSLDPANAPKITGTLDTDGNANDVLADGPYAYVADGVSGLKIVDVSNPAAPTLLAVSPTAGDTWAVEAEGARLALAEGNAGVRLIDATAAANPVELGTVGFGAFIRDVDLEGDLVAAVKHTGEVGFIDASSPGAIIELSATPKLGNGARQVVLSGGYAYVATGNSGLHVVDVGDPSDPVVVGQLGAGAFMLSDVAVFGALAFGADYYRVNSVPIIQVSIPSSPLFAGVVEFSQYGDDNGITIDADPRYVAMIGGASISGEKGATGATNLFIGQHDELSDTAGIPPTCVIETPSNLAAVVEGSRVLVRVQAIDDVFVQRVQFSLDGAVVGGDSLSPYEYSVRLPLGLGAYSLGALAIDTGGNVGACAPVVVNAIPDPGTTVVGRVVDGNGLPVSDASVSIPEHGVSAVSDADGNFLIAAVPTYTGLELVAQGIVDTDILYDAFGPFAPVPGGLTLVGDLVLTTPVGRTIGSALVARPVPFVGSTGTTATGAVLGAPVVAPPVAFFGSAGSTIGVSPVGPVVAPPVAFFGSANSVVGEEPTGPVVARAVPFFAANAFDPGTLESPAGAIVAAPVAFFTSVNASPLDDVAGPLVAAPVSFADQPRVLAVRPAAVSIAAGAVLLEIDGVGFEEATALTFARSGAAYTKLAATGFSVSTAGDALDVTVTIDPTATTGRVVVVIQTNTGQSPTADSGLNSFELTP